MRLLDPDTPAATEVLDLVRSAREHPSAALEAALVAEFLADSGLTPVRNRLLRTLISPTTELEAARSSLQPRSAPLSFGDLVKAFELLLPDDDAQHQGAVFTPTSISTYLAARLLTTNLEGVRVLDPSCGCGALLLAALERIHALTGVSAQHILEHQIHGVDLSEASLARAALLLNLAALALGEDVEELSLNLRCGDSLTLSWEEAFPEGSTFDVVIGNPPYVRYQNLSPQLRSQLAARWETAGHGNFNLYFVFFELARERLSPGGRAGYISPNSFFASASGKFLRQWLSSRRLLEEIVDFGHAKVFDALTYTTLTFFSPSPRTTLRYAQLLEGTAGLRTLDEDSFLEVAQTSLGEGPWRLTSRAHAGAVERIGQGRTLGDVAEIRYGVKTCRDRLFLVSGVPDGAGLVYKTHGSRRYPIEAGLTVAHACVPDLPDEAALLASPQRIIYPYELRDGRAQVIEEDVLRERFPHAYAYLCAVRSELAQRDKGKKQYAAWYAYGRTQGLIPSGPKLLTPEYAARPRFLFDPRTDALFSNGCSVTLREGEGLSLEALQAVLRSGVCHYFVAQTSTVIDGGYFSYQKSRIAGLGIPTLTPREQAELLSLDEHEADLWLGARYGITLPERYIRAAPPPQPVAGGDQPGTV